MLIKAFSGGAAEQHYVVRVSHSETLCNAFGKNSKAVSDSQAALVVGAYININYRYMFVFFNVSFLKYFFF